MSDFCCVTASVNVGLWTFIDEAVNLRNPSANITTFNTPFVPAVPGGNTNVISFLGHKDSYILMENTKELTMSSFTWSAMIFPERYTSGPLFTWWSDWPGCNYRCVSFRLNNKLLKVGVCTGSSVSWKENDTAVMSLNKWHEVAVSYDSNTGSIQIYVDGGLYTGNIGIFAQGVNTGPVVMGSRYHHGGIGNKNFQGKIACMRLWNIVRDLSTTRMSTPLCKIEGI